jgi:hypothetical protein
MNLEYLYIKRPVVEISLDNKNKIMSLVEINITGWAMQQLKNVLVFCFYFVIQYVVMFRSMYTLYSTYV